MDIFSEFLTKIDNPNQQERVKEVLDWVTKEFSDLEKRIAWNQPMFTDHGTFIIGFSISKQHLAVSPERAGMVRFADEIESAGYGYGKMLFRIKWEEPVDYNLLGEIIKFNRLDKTECKTFWRK